MDASRVTGGRGGLGGCQPLPALPRLPPPGFPHWERTVRRGTEPGQGAHVPKRPGATGGAARALCEEAPGEMQGWVPWGGGTPGASDPDRALPPLPRALQGNSRMRQQAARWHWQQDHQPPLCPAACQGTSAAPARPNVRSAPRPWEPGVSALLCGAIREQGFRRSPVPRGTTCGKGNVLAQRGGALDKGLPPSGASCSSWHFPGPATIRGGFRSPQLPLLLPSPGGTRGTGVTRASHTLGTGR